MTSGASAPPGWYDDPSGMADLRWWDGSSWTDHASRDGVVVVVPAPRPGPVRSPLDGPLLRLDRSGVPPAPPTAWRLFDERNAPLGDVVPSSAGGWAMRTSAGRVVASVNRDAAGAHLEGPPGRFGSLVGGRDGSFRLDGPLGTVAVVSPPSPGGWTVATPEGVPVGTVRVSSRPGGVVYDVSWAPDVEEAVRALCAFVPLVVAG